ncbi:FMN-dependent NADH-azoreductase [Glaciecola siphonariae]|uniref:FMN dependent NADH:quinone oxidoreductase n=1 Tax=Glaciecola siphonariae TaxID=521012 RepID=A0ABV9LRX3_9ALTE
MTHVLVINSSLQGKQGNSAKAAELYVASLQAQQSIELSEIDLNEINLPHLTASEMQAWSTPVESRTDEQKQLASFTESFIEQIQRADHIVFAIPMYNFGIPSTLKAFFDRIARAGITFSYTENGPEGLITGKQVTVLAARGGKYQGTPMDTQTEYVKNFLAFLGMKEVNFFYIEGLAMGEESATSAWDKFSEEISEPKASSKD